MAPKFNFNLQFDLFFVTLLLNAALIIAASTAKADFTVFDTRKTLALSDDEKVYRDYYVNMGKRDGVKDGSILSVYRKIPVVDIYRNKTPGDLVIQIAKLRVIHVQDQMSVARVFQQANGKDIPVVQFEKVMLGDRVELDLSRDTSSLVAAQSAKKEESGGGGDDDDDDSDDTAQSVAQ